MALQPQVSPGSKLGGAALTHSHPTGFQAFPGLSSREFCSWPWVKSIWETDGRSSISPGPALSFPTGQSSFPGSLSWDVPALGAPQRPARSVGKHLPRAGNISPLAGAQEHLWIRKNTGSVSRVGGNVGNVSKTLPHTTKAPQA